MKVKVKSRKNHKWRISVDVATPYDEHHREGIMEAPSIEAVMDADEDPLDGPIDELEKLVDSDAVTKLQITVERV